LLAEHVGSTEITGHPSANWERFHIFEITTSYSVDVVDWDREEGDPEKHLGYRSKDFEISTETITKCEVWLIKALFGCG